jgi:hypothetical protein
MVGRLLTAVVLLGLLAIPCFAQSDSSSASPPASPAPTSINPTPVATKKVWTNDDLGTGKVSVPSNKKNQNSPAPAKQPADPATVQRIRASLEKLQGQLDEVNKKLTSYQQFEAGEAVSTAARDTSKGVNRMPVDQQILQLEDKKKQLEGQIGDLIDEARKKGIEPGQLR